ncbi:MAG TPA: TorF family putative porin [Methylotenera sp.]|nr:TorF family putative porin [Methylotenera sp.]
MRKSLLLTAVLGAFYMPAVSFAEEVAPAAAEPASPHTVTYNLGLYSQYIFRGLTQTADRPAIQGGADYSHSSGLYAGVWGSNISWLDDGGNYKHSSAEFDLYGGYRNTIGETGIGYDVGLLNYFYPGSKTAAGKAYDGFTDPYTLEAYGALSYKWLQAKLSYGLTDIFGVEDSDGSYYAELNANIPILDTGLTANLHYGRQDYRGSDASNGGASNDKLYTYNDWKVGVTKSWSNGVNVGAFYTGTDAEDAGYGKALYKGTDLGADGFTAFVQKTF